MTRPGVGADDIAAAHAALQGHVERTPLVASPWLATATGAEVRLKLENVQATGSFKLRGATHALRRADPQLLARGVIAASSGNHGLGVAAAAARLGVAATVVVPTTTPAAKRAAIAARGARVLVHGDDCVVSEAHARQLAAQDGRLYVSPYNDAAVVAGQATVGVELLEQWPAVRRVYVAIGGGGLCGGIAAWLAAKAPHVEVVACSPAASPAMAECVRRGAIVDVPCGPTLSDSTAGGVEGGAVTFPLCRDLVHRWLEVPEPRIAEVLVATLEHQHLLVEGAAAVAIAACLDDPAEPQPAVVVVCGGNLPLATLRAVLARG